MQYTVSTEVYADQAQITKHVDKWPKVLSLK